MLDIASFKELVNSRGGEKRVIAINFNNAYTRVFMSKDPFSFAKNLDETKGYFIFTEKDTRGIEYEVVKPIELIEAVIFAKSDDDIDRVDRRYIHG